MRISVIGTGYVGLVTGVVLADMGNDVICVDNHPIKLEKLRAGISPIYEPGVEELLQRGLAEGRITISDNIREATQASDIVFIAVGTPSMPDGSPDLRAVRAVAQEIGSSIKKYTVVVNKSTVPVGSGELVADIIRSQGVESNLFDVVSNPEFLREGSAVWDTQNPDRVVIGTKRDGAADPLIKLFEPFGCPILVTDLESAELIKYSSNCYLAMKISFINAVSRMCELCGGNVADVAKGIGMDARIGPQFLGAGLGWGGSCFPKDTSGMIDTAERIGYDFHLMKSVVKINDDQTLHFIDRLRNHLGGFSGKSIGILGLAFKPNTDDIRYAKSLIIMDAILKEGGSVRTFDPVAMDEVRPHFPDITYCSGAYEVAEGVDAAVLVTEWNEFKQLDLEKFGAAMKSRVMFDGRRVYNPADMANHGFTYFTVGSN